MKIFQLTIVAIIFALSQSVNSQTTVVYNSTTSTLNGEPFFVKGIYTAAAADLSEIKDAGLNVVMNYGTRDMSQSQALSYLDDAQSSGLYIMFHFNAMDIRNGELSKVLEMVEALKNHSALYAWYLIDEPSLQGITPEQLQPFYDGIKEADPNHPVFTSNWKIRQYYHCTDVDMRQLYHGIPREMQQVLSDDGQRYVATMESLQTAWLAIINTHASKFGSEEDPIYYPSPAQWYDGIEDGSTEYTRRQNRAADLNKADVIGDPFGKEDWYGMGFYRSDNFPETKSQIRGQIACALAYRTNALFWWLWGDGGPINGRWGWYTIFHYTPTKTAHKEILKELGYFEDILTGIKEVDTQVATPGIFYRYIKDDKGRELIVAFNESEVDRDVSLELPEGAGSDYYNLETMAPIDLSTSKLHLDKNGGVFFLSDPVLALNNKTAGKAKGNELYENYPNPFEFQTIIPYLIQDEGSVELFITDIVGKRVRTLVKARHGSGSYTIQWNGMDDHGRKLSPGMYFYVLATDNNRKSKKLLLK